MAQENAVPQHTVDGVPAPTGRRVAFRANEGYARHDPVDGMRYHVAKIVENEPDWTSVASYVHLDNAVEYAKMRNRMNGITEADALDIEISSLRVSNVS